MTRRSLNAFYDEMNAEIQHRGLVYMTHYYPETVMEVFKKGGSPEEAALAIHQVWWYKNGGSGPSVHWK